MMMYLLEHRKLTRYPAAVSVHLITGYAKGLGRYLFVSYYILNYR